MYGEVITVGILLSLLYSSVTGFSPAGLIAAGYLALNIGSPLKLLLTLVVVLITHGLCTLLSHYTILYGRRRFAVTVLISLAVGWGITLLPIPAANLGVVGYLIPGLIAKECGRQGAGITLLSLAAVTALTVLVSTLLGAQLF